MKVGPDPGMGKDRGVSPGKALRFKGGKPDGDPFCSLKKVPQKAPQIPDSVPVLGDIYSRQDRFPISPRFQGPEGFQNLFRPQANAVPPGKADPAKGTAAVTAVLNFQKTPGMKRKILRDKAEKSLSPGRSGPGALRNLRDPAGEPEPGFQNPGGGPGFLPDIPGQIQERAFIFSPEYKKPLPSGPFFAAGSGGLQGFQKLRIQLGITSGDHQAGFRIIPQSLADHPAGFLIRPGGNRTGIDEQNLGGLPPGHEGKALPAESVGQGFTFQLIYFTAQGIYGK
jgi:hypothetical protein